MGKKLQGAKLRALKRARAALDELQEQQAEDAVLQSVVLTTTTSLATSKTSSSSKAGTATNTKDVGVVEDSSLFVVDRVGETVPHHKRPQRKNKKATNDDDHHQSNNPNKKKQKTTTTTTALSSLDKKKIDTMLKVHSKESIQKMVTRGRHLEQLQQHRTVGSGVTTRAINNNRTVVNQDLWASSSSSKDDDSKQQHNKKEEESQKEDKVIVEAADIRSGIGSALAGTAPTHVVVKATRATTTTTKKAATSNDTSLAAVTTKKQQQIVVTPPPQQLPPPPAAIDVAHGGQSYHPDPILHRTVLEQAVAVEVARNRATHYQNTPISQGMSAETKALLLQESDNDDSDEEDTNNTEANRNDDTAILLPKRTDKLTKAQRNKRQRLRVQEAILRQKKAQQKLLNQISEVPRYKKEFKKLEAKKQQEIVGSDATTQKDKNGIHGIHLELQIAKKDPLNAPTLPVVLPREKKTTTTTTTSTASATTSLRTIQPKGSVITDRILSYTVRKQLPHRKARTLGINGKLSTAQQTKRRKRSVKGKHNRDAIGDTFEILG